MHGLVLHFPLIITPVMAPSRCPSPITPVIHMEEDEEHSITPVTMRKLGTAAITGSPHARDHLKDDEFNIITPVTVFLNIIHARDDLPDSSNLVFLPLILA